MLNKKIKGGGGGSVERRWIALVGNEPWIYPGPSPIYFPLSLSFSVPLSLSLSHFSTVKKH